jgi:hypothetical protein
MVWLIVLLIVGIAALIAYRIYCAPPLSATGKQQQDHYLKAFQNEKTLIYQMPATDHTAFLVQLRQHFFDAGAGCFYGNDLIIHVLYEMPQVTIHLFCPNAADLPRHAWRLMQLKSTAGAGAPDG